LASSTSASTSSGSPPEFRPYRRFVTWVVLLFVSLGTAYLLMSVGVSIYRRRNAVPKGERVSEPITLAELRSCFEELEDVTQGLQKHLENFHHLLAGYDPQEAQRWADEGGVWRRQWVVLGRRCRIPGDRGAHLRKELEEVSAAYDELGETHEIYTRELSRFGREQAPRLDRIRQRLTRIGERLSKAAATAGEQK
jgi:hypothetical protein